MRVLFPFLTPISYLEIEVELGRLQTKDQERTEMFNEAVRIANKNAEEIKTWEERYAKTISSHDEEIKKLDSRLVGKECFYLCMFLFSSLLGAYFCLTSLTPFRPSGRKQKPPRGFDLSPTRDGVDED